MRQARWYHLPVFLRGLITSIACLCMAARAQVAPPRGSICGTFYDESGQPAANTEVVAIYLGPHTGPYPAARTDAQGRYCITGMSFGEYALSASDEAKGYPDLQLLFFAPHLPEPRVNLNAAAPDARVDEYIPYKAAFLSIRLSDAETGESVTSMSVSLVVRRDPDHRFMRINTSANQALLIPPNEDVYVNVTSPGYGTWPDDGSKGMVLNLLPGQKKTLTVSLRKVR